MTKFSTSHSNITMFLLLMVPLTILLAGCMSGEGGGLMGLLRGQTAEQSAINSGDPVVIAAVSHAEAMKALIWLGGLAVIGGVGLLFVSNRIMPSSTPIGGGVAGAGVGLIMLAMFEEELKKVASPVFIVLACAGVALVLWLGVEKFILKKKRCTHDHTAND